MAIWNLGSINVDHVYRMAHFPAPGETLAATAYSVGLGGKGANQSVAAARAGRRTRHLGAIGAGDQWVIDRMTEAGIDCEGVQRLTGTATGHAIIYVDDGGENAIVIHPGANRAIDAGALDAALAAIGPADALLIQNETALQVEAASIAKAGGARVIYSAAPFDLRAVQAILPHVSVLAMNAGEAEQLFAAMPGDLPVDGLLITRGGDGAEYRDLRSGERFTQAAFRVDPVDTTGAGDTFAGYFAAGLDRGDGVPDALRLAAAAAALKVTRPGAGDAIPTLDEVMAFLAERGG